MSIRPTRIISFNEVVRCARIVGCTIQDIGTDRLKAKPIIFKPRGDILSKLSASSKVSVFSMECTVEPAPKEKKIDGWYVDIHMRIYYDDHETRQVYRTSPIDAINGNVVTTRSGTLYKLGKMDILVAKQLANVEISTTAPLEEETLPFLINAGHDVYPYADELFK